MNVKFFRGQYSVSGSSGFLGYSLCDTIGLGSFHCDEHSYLCHFQNSYYSNLCFDCCGIILGLQKLQGCSRTQEETIGKEEGIKVNEGSEKGECKRWRRSQRKLNSSTIEPEQEI